MVKENHKKPMRSPLDESVHVMFAWQAQATPHAVALVAGEHHITYEELNRRANQLAHYVQSLGAGPETLVGLYLARGPEVIVALLAVLKAGGGYVPLDPAYPQDRLNWMLADSQASVLLTTSEWAGETPNPHLPIVDLNNWAPIAAQRESTPPDQIWPENVAYVIYTSGSTGKPKGVVIPHGALANHIRATSLAYDINKDDRVLQFASFSFDVAAEEVFPAWYRGATVVLRDEDKISSPAGFLAFVAETGLTVLNLPASYWHLWVQHLESTQAKLPTQLRTVIVGSEPVSGQSLRAWLKIAGRGRRWWNAYGPTESTITSLIYEGQSGAPAMHTVPIGWPLHDLQVYLLNSNYQPVPAGTTGELYIGGRGLARGYLNRPQLTAEKFIPDPFGNGRLYKTGDLGRCGPDGCVEFLGRIDYQVKIRGFRIELAEIEAVCTQHEAVQAAVVVSSERPSSTETHLVAYLVAAQAQRPTTAGLRSFLQSRLPAPMIPTAFVWLEAWPLLPNGKIDRQALPPPARFRMAYLAPRTPLETAVAAIWARVLGVEPVGVRDNFIELGGHSLDAIQIIAHIESTWHLSVSLVDFFAASTVEKLAAAIAAVQPAHLTTLPQEDIPRISSTTLPLLSLAQQQLWLLDQITPGNIAYNVAYNLTFCGDLDPHTLKQSLNQIIARHDVLRTTFIQLDGQPRQAVLSGFTLTLPIVDLSQLSPARREAESHRLLRMGARMPFDLAKGPLIRTTLLCLEATKHLLLLTLHHIVTDGWSLALFLQEITMFYRASVSGQLATLAELPLQYADYAVWQRRQLQGEKLAALLSYWRKQLANMPAEMAFLPAYPRPRVHSFQGERELFTLPQTLHTALMALSHQTQCTLFMLLLAAFHILLSCYTGQTTIVVGTPTANRTRPELDELIGYFVNMLLLCTNLTGDPSFRAFLGQVRQTVLDGYMHQDLPFEKLVETLRPERNLSYNPMFQVAFTYQSVALPTNYTVSPGLSMVPTAIDTGTALFDLRLEIEPSGTVLTGFIEYSTDLFEKNTITEMISNYRHLLENVTHNPAQRLSALMAAISVTPQARPDANPGPNSRVSDLAQRRANLKARGNRLTSQQQAQLKQRLEGN